MRGGRERLWSGRGSLALSIGDRDKDIRDSPGIEAGVVDEGFEGIVLPTAFAQLAGEVGRAEEAAERCECGLNAEFIHCYGWWMLGDQWKSPARSSASWGCDSLRFHLETRSSLSAAGMAGPDGGSGGRPHSIRT